MSDSPPPIPSSDPLPTSHIEQPADYYRGPGVMSGKPLYGTADKLQSLYNGYKGLTWAFLVNILLAGALRAATSAPGMTLAEVMAVSLIGIGITFVIVAAMTFPFINKIGFGKDWSIAVVIVATLLVALNSALFCGVIGYLVLQGIASKEMKKYGLVASGFSGFKKGDVAIRVAQLRELEG